MPTIEAKLEASRAAVEKLHPGRGKELAKPLYVAWAKIPYNLGSWARTSSQYYEGPSRDFLMPDDRIYFAGEGAALSARHAVQAIASRMRETA